MLKKLIVSIMLLTILSITLASAASALTATDILQITSLKVEVDGDRDSSVDDGDSFDVEPGSELEIIIRLENTYDEDTEIEIKDILVEGRIDEIDNDDDLEVEADEFDLDPDDSKSITLRFDIPLKVDHENDYELEIKIRTDEDDNNTDHEINLLFEIQVDKQTHALIFHETEMNPLEVDCDGTGRLTTRLINIGEDEEEDVDFKVTIESMGLIFSDTLTLSENYDDDENEFYFNKLIDFSGLEQGIYDIILEADYANDRKTAVETVPVSIGECEDDEPAPVVTPTPTPPPPETVVVTTTAPPAQASAPVVPTQSAVPQTSFNPQPTTLKQSGSDDTKWIVAIVLTDIALVVFGILIYAGLKKKGGRKSMY